MDLNKLKSLPRYQVLRALLDGNIDLTEAMRAFNIHNHEEPLGGDVAAFVYRSRKDHFHVFVNSALSPDTRKEVFFHELYHIIEEMPQAGYVIGLNRVRYRVERNADLFFEELSSLQTIPN